MEKIITIKISPTEKELLTVYSKLIANYNKIPDFIKIHIINPIDHTNSDNKEIIWKNELL